MQTLPFNRAQYARDFRNKHHSNERQQYKNFKKALDTQTGNVSEFIKHYGISGLPTHLTTLVTPQPIAVAYKVCYAKVGVDMAGWTYGQIGKMVKGGKSATANQADRSTNTTETKSIPSFFSEKWRKLMNLFFETDGGKRITQVTDTTREGVMKLLSDSQNLPISQQASYITDQLDDPEFNRDRALRIARTETTTASSYGTLLGGQDSDYQTGKIWIPVLDANTRPDHAAMAGCEAIGVDETFAVGDSDMLYPGDPNGSGKEVVNCRCCLAIVPVVNDRGMPILK